MSAATPVWVLDDPRPGTAGQAIGIAERLEVPFRPHLLCTVKLSRRLFPQFTTHKLAALIERHELSAPARHRAYDDAHCLWQFFQLAMREFDLDTMEGALKAQLSAQSIPSASHRFAIASVTPASNPLSQSPRVSA